MPERDVEISSYRERDGIVKRVDYAQLPVDRLAVREGRGQMGPQGRPQPLRVLIVADGDDDAARAIMELHTAGWSAAWERVHTAEEFAARLRPDLDVVLCDLLLPQLEPRTALKLLAERGLDVPLIVITSSADQERAVSFLQQGAADCLVKHRMDRLPRAVARALERRRLRRAERRAYEQLRRSERRFRTLVEQSPDAIVTADHAGRITAINARTEDLFGYPRSEVLGSPIELLLPRAADLHRGRRKDGREIPLDVSRRVVHTPDGTLVVAVVRDASAHVRTCDTAAREQLDARDRALSYVSHELRGPLNSIQGFLKLPRFGGHPESHGSAVWGNHGKADAESVLG